MFCYVRDAIQAKAPTDLIKIRKQNFFRFLVVLVFKVWSVPASPILQLVKEVPEKKKKRNVRVIPIPCIDRICFLNATSLEIPPPPQLSFYLLS